MTRAARSLPLGLLPLLLGGAALGPPPAGQAEIIVRNGSFSTLAVFVVTADGDEVGIGQAPPEFSNTLYLAVDAAPVEVRLRARLRGAADVLYESDPVTLAAGSRVRWRVPENALDLGRDLARDLARGPSAEGRRAPIRG